MSGTCKNCKKSLRGLKVIWYCGDVKWLCGFGCAMWALRKWKGSKGNA